MFPQNYHQNLGREKDQGFLLEFHKFEVEEENGWDEETVEKGEEEDLPMIKSLLKQYEDLCSTPSGLPNKREIDHCILTSPGQRLINVRPYKYGHLQKENWKARGRDVTSWSDQT